ncbi:MAG: hypothetical protein ACOZF0_12380 [Thermodesulfobacteriota bacterium]
MKIDPNHPRESSGDARISRNGNRPASFPACLKKLGYGRHQCLETVAVLSPSAKKMTPPVNEPQPERRYFLGTIDRLHPTVSNLLIRDPVFGRDCWRIVHADINRSKPFTRISSGTMVYLDPSTREICWEEGGTATAEKTEKEEPPDDLDAVSQPGGEGRAESCGRRLVKAAQSFIGRQYKEMDCYELLVNALQELGVSYQGKNGLKALLLQMARDAGLVENAYLSGEGIVAAAGRKVFDRTFSPGTDIRKQARQIHDEMKSQLDNGQILSFSTATRGHTGVVDQRDSGWVFINSGRLDHAVEKGPPISRGVGEEFLEAEIVNWLRLAGKRREPLRISVGHLDEDKLSAFVQSPPRKA